MNNTPDTCSKSMCAQGLSSYKYLLNRYLAAVNSSLDNTRKSTFTDAFLNHFQSVEMKHENVFTCALQMYCALLNIWSFLLPVFKPEELRQALMPTLEALYRQDPESLPFRQPVDPQLLGIPVRIRTSNKSNLVRDCTGWHFALILKVFFMFPPFFYRLVFVLHDKLFFFFLIFFLLCL